MTISTTTFQRHKLAPNLTSESKDMSKDGKKSRIAFPNLCATFVTNVGKIFPAGFNFHCSTVPSPLKNALLGMLFKIFMV